MSPTLYLAIGAFLAGLCSGGYGVHTWYKAQRTDAIQEARTTERAGVQTAFQSDLRYIDRLHEQTGVANAKAAAFQSALEENRDTLSRCRVNSNLLGLLNDTGAKPAPGPAAKPQPAAPPVEADPGTSCDAVVETYKWNIDNVIKPNQIQIEELQRFYRDVQKRFNR